MKANYTNFYSNLEVHNISVSSLIADKDKFSEVPEDWHILVADIRNSTEAVKKGNHNHVNLVATGCVIAVMNLAEERGIAIPFFFGGDGATFLIPDELREISLSALEKHNENTRKNFGFNLAIGTLSLAEVYRADIDLKIARVRTNNTLNIPVVLGSGLQYAEEKIKNELNHPPIASNDTPLNLSGMECKWDKIKPPHAGQEVLSLIVAGCGGTDFSKIYSRIMESIDSIYGSIESRKPVSIKRLNKKASLQRIKDEMMAKFGHWNFPEFIKSFFVANFGELYLKNTVVGKSYLQKLVELSDNLTLDGRINTVITGTSKQRKKLISFLDELEELNLIKYGYHVSEESIMSCYVKDLNSSQHIHFVDGGNGGYTKAANQLKEKFQAQLT